VTELNSGWILYLSKHLGLNARQGGSTRHQASGRRRSGSDDAVGFVSLSLTQCPASPLRVSAPEIDALHTQRARLAL
jgi:hypothetical protein